jgi:hypothetical protein
VPAPSWWGRNHQHIYAISAISVAVVGVLVSIVLFVLGQHRGRPSIGDKPVAVSALSSLGLDQVDAVEVKIASDAKFFSPVTMAEFFSRLDKKLNTELQRDQFSTEMLGKTVIWTGRISSISSWEDNAVFVIVRPPDGGYDSAALVFDSSQRGDFLKLKEKQVIRFAGDIDHIDLLAPGLRKCKLLRVVE